ncbi:hypothetical protein, partial [Streptomyces sp. NPDC056664]|uniref:hypothetical protein n=1 Tax=Streptomyces sp. NPDC056664 TaxID=3345900 RepID=UPI0036D39762
IYEEYNETEVNRSLDYLEKKRLWSDFAELTEKLGDFHYEQRNYAEGRSFLKRTIHAQTQILKGACQEKCVSYSRYFFTRSFRWS